MTILPEVVSIGLMNMSRLPLPGPLSLLRALLARRSDDFLLSLGMMRAFRVFRLFKRLSGCLYDFLSFSVLWGYVS